MILSEECNDNTICNEIDRQIFFNFQHYKTSLLFFKSNEKFHEFKNTVNTKNFKNRRSNFSCLIDITLTTI